MKVQNAKSVANWLLKLAEIERASVSHLKLQKLAFLVQGYHLAITDSPAFSDHVEAWKLGPVIRTIYDEFKNCGSEPITEMAKRRVWSEDKTKIIEQECNLVDASDITIAIIKAVWGAYKKYTGFQLVDLTHKSKTPWSEVYVEGSSRIIDNEIIKQYYKKLCEPEDDAAT